MPTAPLRLSAMLRPTGLLGPLLGGLLGGMMPFDMKWLDFALTALFVVLFL